jgi:ABC-type Fe3+ transport system substrate-binding protein
VRKTSAALVAAALVAATPALAQSPQERWDQVLDAAKHEGKIVISHFTDKGIEPILREFEATYGIKVEASPGRPSSVIPKIVTEQENGQFNWDVLLQPGNNVRLVLERAHGLEPILPFLILPEVTNDSNWYGGLTGKLPMDPLYVFDDGISGVGPGIDVNRDKVGPDQVSDWPDLLKPQWKKRFAIYYPDRPANLTVSFACYRPAFATEKDWENFVRAFFAQQPVASPEFRIVADWLAQGRFDVTVGAEGSYLDTLKSKLKRNIEFPVGRNLCGNPPDGTGRAISIPKNPPDRNAATVFVNWYLTKHVQDEVMKDYLQDGDQSVSRRKDAVYPDAALQQKIIAGFSRGWLAGKGLITTSDEGLELQNRVIELAKEAGY